MKRFFINILLLIGLIVIVSWQAKAHTKVLYYGNHLAMSIAPYHNKKLKDGPSFTLVSAEICKHIEKKSLTDFDRRMIFRKVNRSWPKYIREIHKIRKKSCTPLNYDTALRELTWYKIYHRLAFTHGYLEKFNLFQYEEKILKKRLKETIKKKLGPISKELRVSFKKAKKIFGKRLYDDYYPTKYRNTPRGHLKIFKTWKKRQITKIKYLMFLNEVNKLQRLGIQFFAKIDLGISLENPRPYIPPREKRRFYKRTMRKLKDVASNSMVEKSTYIKFLERLKKDPSLKVIIEDLYAGPLVNAPIWAIRKVKKLKIFGIRDEFVKKLNKNLERFHKERLDSYINLPLILVKKHKYKERLIKISNNYLELYKRKKESGYMAVANLHAVAAELLSYPEFKIIKHNKKIKTILNRLFQEIRNELLEGRVQFLARSNRELSFAQIVKKVIDKKFNLYIYKNNPPTYMAEFLKMIKWTLSHQVESIKSSLGKSNIVAYTITPWPKSEERIKEHLIKQTLKRYLPRFHKKLLTSPRYDYCKLVFIYPPNRKDFLRPDECATFLLKR